jgi:SAM-dependent methyltransferase
VRERFSSYVGVDEARYDGFPADGAFHAADLNSLPVPLSDAVADVCAGVETIEHLENPRAFFRELVRLVKPGGWLIVTTPNQLSLLSKLTLVTKNQFNAFQEAPGLYPAHITALLEFDLLRIAAECGILIREVLYSLSGRIPGTGFFWPRAICRLMPRTFSDNVLVVGQKPRE